MAFFDWKTMANTKPLTYSQLKAVLQALIEQNTDTPDTDDVAYWLIVANRLIGDWEEEAEWDVLWTYESAGGTVAVGDTTYPMSADVKKLSENVELVHTDGSIEYIPVVDVTEKQYWTEQLERFVYVTGVAGSYVLNLGWTPVTDAPEIGATIKYPYYKYATKLASDADVIEMSDPNWLVDAIVAEVSNQPYKKTNYTNRAIAKMEQMKFNNERSEDQSVPDDEFGMGI